MFANICRDFHFIPLTQRDAIRKTQGRGPEKMHMNVSGPAEPVIFEMVVFQICNGVGHVVLPAEEGLSPDDLSLP